MSLRVALLAYCVASFVHFSHNAIFIDDYPNLPAWLTPFIVYATWCVEAAIGLGGYLLCRKALNRRAAEAADEEQRSGKGAGASRVEVPTLIGLGMIAVYAALAYDGLAHYARAPMSAHTLAMNLTIWAEVVAGTVLLGIAGTPLAAALFTGSRPLRRS